MLMFIVEDIMMNLKKHLRVEQKYQGLKKYLRVEQNSSLGGVGWDNWGSGA